MAATGSGDCNGNFGGAPPPRPPPSDPLNLNQIPAKVESVQVTGLDRTKDEYLQSFISGLFSVSSFDQLITTSSEVKLKLEESGCFKNVGLVIDISDKGLSPHGFQVIFDVIEVGRVSGQINTMMSSNCDATLGTGIRLLNIFGSGEKLAYERTYGSGYSNTFHVTLTKPLPILPPLPSWVPTCLTNYSSKFISSPRSQSGLLSANYHTYSQPGFLPGVNFRGSGLLTDFSLCTRKKSPSNLRMTENFQWEGTWRNCNPQEGGAIPTENALHYGHSFKSALKYILSIGTRNDPLFPRSGFHLRSTSEVAGLFKVGDARFFKQEFDLQYNKNIKLLDVIFQGNLRIGHMSFLGGGGGGASTIPDLFYVGGPQTLRGFEQRSIGRIPAPVEDTRGMGYWLAGLHLYIPIPLPNMSLPPEERNIRINGMDVLRAHLFLNAGNVESMRSLTCGFLKDSLNLFKGARVSMGWGVCVKLGNAAVLELNACHPIVYGHNDRIVRGFQLGVGVEFI